MTFEDLLQQAQNYSLPAHLLQIQQASEQRLTHPQEEISETNNLEKKGSSGNDD